MKILFTGGGTGGHIFPIIAIAREIRRIYLKSDLKLFYIGPKDEFSKILLSQEGIKVKTIICGKIRRYFSFWNFIDIFFKIPIGILQSFFSIFLLSPDLIFSKGGYGSIPAVISGWIFGVPIFLHESDISPGLANRFLSKFVSEIFVSFPKTEFFAPKKVILVGNPIRRELLEGSKEEALEFFKITGGKPVILILGGSQGAQKINEVLLLILPEMLRDFELIHQTGSKNFKEVKAQSRAVIPPDLGKYYHLHPFFQERELKLAYSLADLIVARAGSGTVFEIAALGKPSILIPLPLAAQNHQMKNAYSFAEGKGSIIIEETNFTPHFFLERLKFLFANPKEIENMEKKAKEFARPEAARVIAKYILEFLGK